MANILNIDAETDANIIGDDSSPTLTMENTSSGNVIKIQNASGTGTALQVDGSRTGAQLRSTATEQVPLHVTHSVISSPTVAPLRITQSAASGAHFEIQGAIASIASMTSITRGLRVKQGDTYYWITLYRDATYI